MNLKAEKLMCLQLINDYTSLLTFSTFVGSIALFSDYLSELNSLYEGKRSPVSRILCKAVIFFNHFAISLVWICTILLLLCANVACHPRLYKIIPWILICASVFLTVTLISQWLNPLINTKILAPIKEKNLSKAADEDISELKKL